MPRFTAFLVLLLAARAHAGEVPAWLVRLPESTPTAYIAETSAAAFHRYDRAADTVVRVGTDYMSIGLGGTGKQRAGDQRTPLGIYFVTEQLDTTRMHEKYGPMAFPLDYPNAWDRRLGRTGDGIWVHGVDPRGGTRPPRDTDGCIALPNERLLALESTFRPNVTPVLIAEKLRVAESSEIALVRTELTNAVLEWAAALEEGDMYRFLAAYDASYERWGMNREEWAAFSLQTYGARPITSVEVGDLLLLGDPAEDGLYLSRFHLEVIEGETGRTKTVRRLYWRRSEGGALKIVAADGG